MPCLSYSLPAILACPTGAQHAKIPGTVCSICYARKHRYAFGNVRPALARRLEILLADKENGYRNWARNVIAALRARRGPYFRWHDSGDLLDSEHLAAICEIATALPRWRFWLPTHEAAVVLAHGKMPPNLCVRLSATYVDGPPLDVGLPTSTVHRDNPQGLVCSANGKCGSCRACWYPTVRNVSYKLH